MTREPDPVWPEEWLLEAYFDEAPSPDTLSALKALAPSAGDVEPIVERLAEEDWVTLSQAGLEPIHAGRFFVHTPAHRDKIPADAVPLEIDAGRAFGTGQRSEEHTSELQSLMRISYAVFCLKKKKTTQ